MEELVKSGNSRMLIPGKSSQRKVIPMITCKFVFIKTTHMDVTDGKPRSLFKRIVIIITLLAILIGGIVFWWNYLYVFGEGVKSGQLNYVVKKGNVFKTYEGKLIQSGLRSQ